MYLNINSTVIVLQNLSLFCLYICILILAVHYSNCITESVKTQSTYLLLQVVHVKKRADFAKTGQWDVRIKDSKGIHFCIRCCLTFSTISSHGELDKNY